MLQLDTKITLLPYLHGQAGFAQEVRKELLANNYDIVAVDLPEIFQNELLEALEHLPAITAVCAIGATDPCYFVPVDPCDAAIEALRQARAHRATPLCIGSPQLAAPPSLDPLPDEHARGWLGSNAYATLCLGDIAASKPIQESDTVNSSALHVAARLHELGSSTASRVLCLVHLRQFAQVVRHYRSEYSWNYTLGKTPGYRIETYSVNQDHLYFVLGELPFVAGCFEKNRYDPLAEPIDPPELLKELFCQTRNDYYNRDDRLVELSPARIQIALTFLRNLTVQANRLMPSLFDIIAAAKGVGGNTFAVRMLKSARYYPYLSLDLPLPVLSAGIDKVRLGTELQARGAVNLLKDTRVFWQTLSIKPDPDDLRKQKYRYQWDPTGMCSHVPEDERIERFNGHVRTRALRSRAEDMARSEKFVTSVRDGIDIRETLRNWYSGAIYVRELPPARGSVDTVVIIFDSEHDDLYGHRGTWYAEHPQESTLTFYATDPFDNLIGPGVSRCEYGGLSLLFPPRSIPNPFELTLPDSMVTAAQQLTWGALMFSRERVVAYVAAKKPDLVLLRAARKLKKHLVWIPLGSFSTETLRRLRRFHVLNGRQVRSWASRFIGD